MNFFFCLGRIPSLSILELDHVFQTLPHKPRINDIYRDVLIAGAQSLEPDTLMRRVGGTPKLGECIITLSGDFDLSKTASLIAESVPYHSSRITVGFSAYSLPWGARKIRRSIESLGFAVKKILREKTPSVRIVLPTTESALSSVQVEKNKLVSESGYEFVLLPNTNGITVGRTQAIQPFEEYSFRDWNRPGKTPELGLLPPKIAQIMINLAGIPPEKHAVLYDPFCGSGTVLQEALLMGYGAVWGGDIEKNAVSKTKENLSWLSEKKNISLKNTRVFQADATKQHSQLQASSIDAIITEPYLGPLFQKHPSDNDVRKTISSLSSLYLSFFDQAKRILKKNGSLIVVWPVWRGRTTAFLPIYEQVIKKGFVNTTIPPSLPYSFPDRTHRGGILFSRPHSVVGRELFVFRVGK